VVLLFWVISLSVAGRQQSYFNWWWLTTQYPRNNEKSEDIRIGEKIEYFHTNNEMFGTLIYLVGATR